MSLKISDFLYIDNIQKKASFDDVINQFFLEIQDISKNLWIQYVTLRLANDTFPNTLNSYQACWYKKIFIAAILIKNKILKIEYNDDIVNEVFNEKETCDFLAFLKNTSEIITSVKKSIPSKEWMIMNKKYEIESSIEKLNNLASEPIKFNLEKLKELSWDLSEYENDDMEIDFEGDENIVKLFEMFNDHTKN